MLNLDELILLRSITDDVEVKGSSALALVRLQMKLDAEIAACQRERFAPPVPEPEAVAEVPA